MKRGGWTVGLILLFSVIAPASLLLCYFYKHLTNTKLQNKRVSMTQRPTGLIALDVVLVFAVTPESLKCVSVVFNTRTIKLVSCSQSKPEWSKRLERVTVRCFRLSRKSGRLDADDVHFDHFEAEDWKKAEKKKPVTSSQRRAQTYFWIARSASNVVNSCLILWLSNVWHQAIGSFNCTQTHYSAGNQYRYHQSACFIKWLNKPSDDRTCPSAVICICLPSLMSTLTRPCSAAHHLAVSIFKWCPWWQQRRRRRCKSMQIESNCAPPTRSSACLLFTEASEQVSKLPLHLLNNSVSRLCANIDNCLITRRRVTCFYLRDDNSLRMWRGRSRGAPRIECHSAPRPRRKRIPVISLRHLIPNSRRDSTMRWRSCSLRALVGEATWNFQGCFHCSEGEK